MLLLARYALIIPAIIVMAYYVPLVFDAAVGERITKTHLFYSPVIKKFIWLEKASQAGGNPLADDHHTQFVQQDQDGGRYTRQEFEKLLPFIYYRNMELWGLLPLKLEGQTFDKQTIKGSRQVIELTPREIGQRAIGDGVHPLLESVKGAARLVFPEDRFRLGREIEFINADYNRRDEAASQGFTEALRRAGFSFPGQGVFGKPTVLKPFDAGVFLGDAKGNLFHLKRVKGMPWVRRVPLDPGWKVRFIKVSENRRKEFYGLLLTEDGRLHLLSYDNYRPITLQLPDYDPETMDFKLIINPLYRTAVYSDDHTIRAVVMNRQYRALDSYAHTMPGATLGLAQRIFDSLTPFRLSLEDPAREYLSVGLDWHGWRAAVSIGLAMLVYLVLAIRRRRKGPVLLLDGVLLVLTGLYGLAAVLLLPPQNSRAQEAKVDHA